jgi:hypothetical protein
MSSFSVLSKFVQAKHSNAQGFVTPVEIAERAIREINELAEKVGFEGRLQVFEPAAGQEFQSIGYPDGKQRIAIIEQDNNLVFKLRNVTDRGLMPVDADHRSKDKGVSEGVPMLKMLRSLIPSEPLILMDQRAELEHNIDAQFREINAAKLTP